MPKKECRYDKSHKFNTEEEQLEHEAKCPTKKKRTDLKECPYSNRHILTIKQYERHIKNCKFKPKMVKKEVNKNDDNSNSNTNKDKVILIVNLNGMRVMNFGVMKKMLIVRTVIQIK